MRNHFLNTSSALAATLLLAGCAVGPDYRAPTVAAPATFNQAHGEGFVTTAVDARWWAGFGDPVLDKLVRDALAQNHDVRIAAARLAEARALRSEARWAFAPSGGASGGFQRTQLTDSESGVPDPAPSDTWTTGVDAAWELDLFGRLRRSAEAASADLAASEADLRAVRVALLGDVASTYFALRGTEETASLVRGQIDLLTSGLAITQSRLDAGRGTPLDSARAEALLHETAALLPGLESDIAVYHHRLAVLTGRQPEGFALPPAAKSTSISAVQAVAIDSPAAVLRRRPDIARAERQLAAATAKVGVETAALFPDVSIRGFFRFVGLEADDLGRSGTQAWSVAPSIRWSVLDQGRLRARVAASHERASGALAAYERSVLLALEETETALARYRGAMGYTISLQARYTASERARIMAQRQYEAGSADPLALLDAERTALVAARDAVSARTAERVALVFVYKALGGGWESPESS